MGGHLFYGQRAIFVFIETSMVLFATALVGYGVGRIFTERIRDRSLIGVVQASILGLLALMLGFTFAAASARYDDRRLLAVDEANALGTTFLRAQTLPEPYRTKTSQMIRKYVDLRIQSISVFDNLKALIHTKSETERLQQDIWAQAAAAARHYPNPITMSFIESLNESIDLYSSRIAAFNNRVPDVVLWVLAFIAMAALAITGYSFGLAGQRTWIVMAFVSVLVAVVIIMIVDLDQPQTGPTQVSQQSMLDLRSGLSGFEERSREIE